MAFALSYRKMKWNADILKRFSVLDVAIMAGLAGIFLAIAVPVTQGAVMRHRTAQCARKIMEAAGAFDAYAASAGGYSHIMKDPYATEDMMRSPIAASQIPWWRSGTELGGRWSWCNDGRTLSVVITGVRLPERRMARLDALLDDGNLHSGMFQHRADGYHYILKEAVL